MLFETNRNYVAPFALAVTFSTSCISDGMHYGWASPAIPKIATSETIKLTSTGIFLIESLYLLGGVITLPVIPIIADRLGRKWATFYANICGIVAWILIGIELNIEALCAARFFAGAAAGSTFFVVPMYLAEVSDKKIRGFLGSFPQLVDIIGMILCYAIVPFISFVWSSTIGGIFIVIQISLFWMFPESPYFYLMHNNIPEAEKSLKWFRGNKYMQSDLREMQTAINQESRGRARFFDLFLIPVNRKSLAISGVLMMGSQLSGSAVIYMNLHEILTSADSMISPNMSAIIFGVMQVMALLPSSILLDKWGRKLLLYLSCSSTCVVLFCLATYFAMKHNDFDLTSYSWIPLVCVLCYAVTLRLGLGYKPFVIMSEVFPTNVRSYGMMVGFATYEFTGACNIYIYNKLRFSYGHEVPFYLFAVYCLLLIGFTAYFVPETKARTLEQIQDIISGGTQKSNNPETPC